MPKANLLDQLTPEERARIEKRHAEREASKPQALTREWYSLAELGYYCGWGAVQAVLDDVITLEQANALIDGARKVHDGQVYDTALAVAAGSSNSVEVFEALMKPYKASMRAVR